jgi:hypothetical protein
MRSKGGGYADRGFAYAGHQDRNKGVPTLGVLSIETGICAFSWADLESAPVGFWSLLCPGELLAIHCAPNRPRGIDSNDQVMSTMTNV